MSAAFFYIAKRNRHAFIVLILVFIKENGLTVKGLLVLQNNSAGLLSDFSFQLLSHIFILLFLAALHVGWLSITAIVNHL